MHHITIKTIQSTVFQHIVIGQIPLTAGMVARPAVALSREVNPLRMAEFVAHEVQIAAGAERQGHQTNELVQRHSPINRHIRCQHRHGIVHFPVNHSEDHRFVTHQCLIVAFGIANRLFFRTFIRHLEVNLSHVPVVVGLGFEGFNPVVSDTH